MLFKLLPFLYNFCERHFLYFICVCVCKSFGYFVTEWNIVISMRQHFHVETMHSRLRYHQSLWWCWQNAHMLNLSLFAWVHGTLEPDHSEPVCIREMETTVHVKSNHNNAKAINTKHIPVFPRVRMKDFLCFCFWKGDSKSDILMVPMSLIFAGRLTTDIVNIPMTICRVTLLCLSMGNSNQFHKKWQLLPTTKLITSQKLSSKPLTGISIPIFQVSDYL